MPVGQASHKRVDPEPGAEVRLEMTRRAASADPLVEASDLETSRDGPSFMRSVPWSCSIAATPADQLVFLLGADVAAGLEGWMEPRRVIELARLGVAGRPGTAAEEAEAAIERLGGSDRAEVVRMPELGISSTGIRGRVAAGRPIPHLVPDPVVSLIAELGLYA